MQFRNLAKQYNKYRSEIDEAVGKVMEKAAFIMGENVSELEGSLSKYVGVKYCDTCANGTDALQLALMAWGVGPNDVVFVPDFTFFSSGEVVSAVGAIPVFVDIEKDTFNISPESLENAIELVLNKTEYIPKVIVTVDLFGLPADYKEVRAIANKYGLYILEDSAQGFGGTLNSKKACSFGDIATTSFFPAKPLGCYGDGGAIFTDNEEWHNAIKSLRIHGKGQDKYDNVRIGMNSRLDTIQAAILDVKLKHFDDELMACNANAAIYDALIKNPHVTIPTIPEGYISSWAQYTVLFDENERREEAMQLLKNEGIPSMIYYKKPMHLQKAFSPLRVNTECPVTEYVSQRCLSLPMGPFITEEDIESVCRVLNSID